MTNDNASVIDNAKREKQLLLVGTPNVGKSVIFGILTGRYAMVSNYPGTTVEVTRGKTTIKGTPYAVIDTPGVNNLTPMSEDERVTRDILLEPHDQTVIQVCDAKNLKQALFITLQLAELGKEMILALNMWDEALEKRVSVDVPKLAKTLGIEVIPTIATHRVGTSELISSAPMARTPTPVVDYGKTIEAAIAKIDALLPHDLPVKRPMALMLLSGDQTVFEWLSAKRIALNVDELENVVHETQKQYAQPLGYMINQYRQRTAEQLTANVMVSEEKKPHGFTERFGRWAMHPLYGVPLLVVVLAAMWYVVGVFGAGTVVDFVENTLFGRYFVPNIQISVEAVAGNGFIYRLLVGEYGIVSMALTYSIAIVLPIVTFFFIFFGILEDSGYMPRLAILSDRLFKFMGLNGRAVLPMILGLGCGTMATMTTRILATKRERVLVTLLLALGVPCSAQLGAILGIIGTPFSAGGMIWFGTILFVVILTGFLASKIVPGTRADFLIEIPPIRLPRMYNIFFKTINRLKWYLKEAVPLFIVGTLLLFALHELNLLITIQNAASPVIEGILGLPRQATECFIIGFLRRDYGAAGLLIMAENGVLNKNQVIVSLVVITLFVPCIAQFLVMIKERGMKTALGITIFVVTTAFAVGGLLRVIMDSMGVVL